MSNEESTVRLQRNRHKFRNHNMSVITIVTEYSCFSYGRIMIAFESAHQYLVTSVVCFPVISTSSSSHQKLKTKNHFRALITKVATGHERKGGGGLGASAMRPLHTIQYTYSSSLARSLCVCVCRGRNSNDVRLSRQNCSHSRR